MLNQLATTSEAHFKRQVNPSVEGHLRAESRQEVESKQTERANEREALRADRQERSRDRMQQQQTSELRHESQGTRDRAASVTSQAAEMAEDLTQKVREAKREETRQYQDAGFSHQNKTRQITQTYQQDLPSNVNRIIDEIA